MIIFRKVALTTKIEHLWTYARRKSEGSRGVRAKKKLIKILIYLMRGGKMMGEE